MLLDTSLLRIMICPGNHAHFVIIPTLLASFVVMVVAGTSHSACHMLRSPSTTNMNGLIIGGEGNTSLNQSLITSDMLGPVPAHKGHLVIVLIALSPGPPGLLMLLITHNRVVTPMLDPLLLLGIYLLAKKAHRHSLHRSLVPLAIQLQFHTMALPLSLSHLPVILPPAQQVFLVALVAQACLPLMFSNRLLPFLGLHQLLLTCQALLLFPSLPAKPTASINLPLPPESTLGVEPNHRHPVAL